MFGKKVDEILEMLELIKDRIESQDLKEELNDVMNLCDNVYFDMNFEIEKLECEIEDLNDYMNDLRYSLGYR